MIITVDDLCLEYIENFVLFDSLKMLYPEFKLIAFTIGNFRDKENLAENNGFKAWFEKRKDWVEIAVHAYTHDVPDGDKDDEGEWIRKAYESLKMFLPAQYGYRSPGWQTTNKTESILKELGFSYIAYETKIKHFTEQKIETNIINSHLYDVNSIHRIYEILEN